MGKFDLRSQASGFGGIRRCEAHDFRENRGVWQALTPLTVR